MSTLETPKAVLKRSSDIELKKKIGGFYKLLETLAKC